MNSLERAIVLVERSAVARSPQNGVEEAIFDPGVLAGEALLPHVYPYPEGWDDMPDEEDDWENVSPPADRNASLVASFAANVVVSAVRTAAATPQESAQTASDAFGFAMEAIQTAGEPGLMELLEMDFVSADAQTPRRPWWRFW